MPRRYNQVEKIQKQPIRKEILTPAIEIEEIENALNEIKNNRSPGEDRIVPKMLKKCRITTKEVGG